MLAECVAHLVNHAAQLSMIVIGVIDRQRIEHQTEHTRIAQQQHAPARGIKACLCKQPVGPFAQGLAIPAAMVFGIETQQIETSDREKPRTAVGRIEPVEINQQIIDMIAEAMTDRLQTRMTDHAIIKPARPVGGRGKRGVGRLPRVHSAASVSMVWLSAWL
jgi:hypothetical protein